jgi:type IV pilus assembly protein PilP
MRLSARVAHRAALALSVSLFGFLAGCGGGSSEELNQWVLDQRKQQRMKLAPIAAPKKFSPQAFTAPELADPYSPLRLSSALKRESKPVGDGSALVKPELARQAKLKQPLESIPLDGMNYVGQFIKDGRSVALLRVNGLLHQVVVGDYLGQNFGRVMRVSDNEVVVREIVQDAEGEWSERPATLLMTQGAK